MKAWNRYWFADTACVNLAVLRIATCFILLFHVVIFHDYTDALAERFAYDDSLYRPLMILKLMNAPFGLLAGAEDLGRVRPPDFVVRVIFILTVAAGLTGLVGIMSRLSALVAAAGFTYIQAFVYSFGDFHHPEAILAFALGAVALAPCGNVLSVDNWLRARRGQQTYDLLDESPYAGWSIKLIQWFFVLMYLSAVWAKIENGGLSWMNGYTLQFFLAQDGMRWGSDLAVWASQYHLLIMLGQIGVILFQATFALEVIFPVLRWIYVPVGLLMHTMIYVLLRAPFFIWAAMYVVFIPWDDIVRRLRAGQVERAGSRA
jgi:hypothetical protein